MDVDGYYNFILTKVSPSRVIPQFLRALAERWPGLLIRDLDYQRLKSFRVYAYNSASSEIHREEGSILISKDESMEKGAQEMGFRLLDSGEASLLLIYNEGRSRNYGGEDPTIQEWRSVFDGLEERISDNHSDIRGVPGESKGKLAGIFSYTLVTPKDPNEDDFSAWAVQALVEAYSRE